MHPPDLDVQAHSPEAAPTVEREILASEEFRLLKQRSDGRGLLRLGGHLGVMILALWLHVAFSTRWLIAVPALVLYGFSLATMFAALHECVHRTAFKGAWLNDAVAWGAGVLSFYNSTYYRRYHGVHHRFTQIPGKDPELDDPKPRTIAGYLVEVSGATWWMGKLRTHFAVASGRVEASPFIPPAARAEVIRSTRAQLGVYAGLIVVSVVLGRPLFLMYWLLPLAVGQPLLRAILLAEHTGCTQDDDPFTNTRTTLTLWPVRFLMWNMPYHAEHHLYPAIPFHALSRAHAKLGPHLSHVGRGYLDVNRVILAAIWARRSP
jgi:fatty acid desaturase